MRIEKELNQFRVEQWLAGQFSLFALLFKYPCHINSAAKSQTV
jgi:hypothetical protein